MSIERDFTHTLAKTNVGNDYDVELMTRDPFTGGEVVISLTPDEADQLADELRDLAASAREARAVDDVARADATVTHGFDIDWPVHS